MTSYNVTAEFGAGSAGTVVFRRKVWLNDNGALIPPAETVATLAGSPPGFVQSLRATSEVGVAPEDWSYEVIVRITGQEDLVGSMFLTADADLVDVFQFVAPEVGDYYATKAELSALTEALGGTPVTEAYVDDAVADEALARDAADDAEAAARLAADGALDTRLDAEEAATASFDTRLDAEEAATAAYDTRLDALEAADISIDTRLDATELEAKEEVLVIAVGDEVTALTTDDNPKVTFRMPFAFTLTAVRASLTTVSSSGTVTVDINEGGTTILSTKLTIDASEKTSTTAATPAVISDGSLADDAEITIDVDVAGTDAAGLKVALIGSRT